VPIPCPWPFPRPEQQQGSLPSRSRAAFVIRLLLKRKRISPFYSIHSNTF